MEQFHKLPLNLPFGCCGANGEVVAQLAQLEIELQILLRRAMGLDNWQRRVLTVRMAEHRRFSIGGEAANRSPEGGITAAPVVVGEAARAEPNVLSRVS